MGEGRQTESLPYHRQRTPVARKKVGEKNPLPGGEKETKHCPGP